MRWLLIVVSVLFLSACSVSGMSAYQRGNTAYEKGDYKAAFSHYLYAANHRVTAAQYAVGYQYFYGLGVKRDDIKAIRWFEHAARHSAQAKHALYIIHKKRLVMPWVVGIRR